MNLQGYILTSEIDGTIQMKSYLTGNPEIKLALNEDVTIGRGGSSGYGIYEFFYVYGNVDFVVFCLHTIG